MFKQSSLNVTMLLFSLLAAAFVFALGEAVLVFLSDLPFIVQTAIYLTFVTCFVFLAIILSEKVSTGHYIPRGRVTFSSTAAKAAAILVPVALVLGLVTQLIYGLLGAANEVVGVEDYGVAFRSHHVFESSQMQSFLLSSRLCVHTGAVSSNPISTVQEPYEFVGMEDAGLAYRSRYVLESEEMRNHLLVQRDTRFDGFSSNPITTGAPTTLLLHTTISPETSEFDLGFYMQQYFERTYTGAGFPATFDEFVANMFNADFSVDPENVEVFLDVLQNGFIYGAAGSSLTFPVTSITAEAVIYDGAVNPDDAGKIDINFYVETATGVHSVVTGVNCRPAHADSFGHGLIHSAFYDVRRGMIRVYAEVDPHLLQVNLSLDAEEGAVARTSAIPAFDLGLHMHNYFETAHAGGALPGTFDEFVAGMFGSGGSVSSAHRDIFLSVLHNGFDSGFRSVSLPSPITAITTQAVIFDGRGYFPDAGKIDIHFNVTTNDGSEWMFYSVSCGGSVGPFALDTYGHGFVQDGFENRPFGYRNIYEAYRPHLLLVPEGPNADSILRIAIQTLMLTLWGAFIGLAVVLFLNNSKLIGSFFVPRIVVSIFIAGAFSMMMAHLDADLNMAARGLFAIGMCLLYLPTFGWGSVGMAGPGEPGAWVPKR